ncbi:hypothetical protein AU252_01470 [Pseudarthrobacter sulfonivorans]|uniref:Major facilitator superfamily (MFS) profile domain-containing protein n=1 Tax=Pseudarthrobacter sulfonivorans TaxID=121292 RepID=A0A0U3NT34_9MICC|nr:hypothetical protein AU252_01470 [Pseudarthrobacter sulfonivorans]
MLATPAIFAVGFVARPMGSVVFGWLGDRRGRKASMTLAVGLASLGSLLIAVVPGYDSAGAFASVMLLAARLLQGLAHGGEQPSAQTYISEMAPKEKRGLWSTLVYTSGMVGILFGTVLGAVLAARLSDAEIMAWGWRVPFAIGAVLGLTALYMRSHMAESAGSILLAVFAKLFPTSIRTMGPAVPYAICVAVFGGTVPYLHAWLVRSTLRT